MMLRLISILVMLAVVCGCVKKTPVSDDSSSPNKVSIAYLKTLYVGKPFNITREMDISGVVTANDRYGAFVKGIVIEDETGGIELKMNSSQLFSDYPIGCHLRVRCFGLTLGGYGGEVSLGAPSNNPKYENAAISFAEIGLSVLKMDKVEKLQPREVTIGELTQGDVSRFVCLENVQFIDDELGLTWCDEGANTNRHLIDSRGDTLIVRTDYSAQFAYEKLPAGSGYIEGVLGCFVGEYQLRLVYGKFVVMEDTRF